MKLMNISVVIPCGPRFIPPPPCVQYNADLHYAARWVFYPDVSCLTRLASALLVPSL